MVRKVVIALMLSGFLGLLLVENGSSSVQAAPSNADRALASYSAMQKYFFVNDGSLLYQEWYPRSAGDNPYSYLWPFSQARQATIDLVNLPHKQGQPFNGDVQQRNQALEHYWNTTGTTGLPGYDSYVRPPYGNGGDKFYDDNAWVGLSDIQWYNMSKDSFALARAKQIFALAVSGWDTDATHPAPGGVFWTQASWSHDRNTISNMPNAELGLRLYQITRDQYYFDWAKKMYEWTYAHLLAPNGLFWDHIDLAGNIDKTQWSYNQGVSVGANVLLFHITGDSSYLQRAEALTKAALAYYVDGGRLYTQPPYFNAIFFKNLLLLQSVDRDEHARQVMQNYADTTWRTARDTSTGLFHFSKADQTYLLEQAGMTQIYTILAWNPDQYKDLY